MGKLVNLLLLSVLLQAKATGQDINGTWKGNTSPSIWILNSTSVVVEINITHDSVVTGITHAYYNGGQYEHYRINGIYHRSDSTIVFTEDSVISYYLGNSKQCFGRYVMRLSKLPGKLQFRGTWNDKKGRRLFGCPTLDILLEKPWQEIEKKNFSTEKNDIEDPRIAARQTEIQTLIEIDPIEKDSIRIDLYDNGEIDHDTVSIFLDEKPLALHRMISATPIRLYVSMDREKPIQRIRMVADNLGSIPPNTGLMIITTKNHRYEIRLSSDMNKNAAVEFFLKEQ
jgi:hypothetical protein